MTVKRTVTVLIALIALLVVALPALALPPEIERLENTNEDNPDVFVDLCGPGADVMGVYHESIAVTTFFDNAGNVRDIKVQVHFLGELTRLDTGKSLSDPGYITEWIDPETGEITHNGLVYSWTVPGQGIVYQATGKVIFSADFEEVLFVAGPHDPVEGLDGMAVLCDALA